jgi:hypothetical protein
MEAFAKFLEFLKVPIKYIIGLFVVGLVFLFAPGSLLNKFGLLNYREEGKAYFGLVSLILAVLIIGAIVGALIDKFHGYFFLRSMKNRLKFLTTEEKQILWQYIEGETRSLYLSIESGVVKGLVHDQIIYRSSSISTSGYGALTFAHNIQPWAWKYLNEHRDLLTR